FATAGVTSVGKWRGRGCGAWPPRASRLRVFARNLFASSREVSNPWLSRSLRPKPRHPGPARVVEERRERIPWDGEGRRAGAGDVRHDRHEQHAAAAEAEGPEFLVAHQFP